MKNRLVSLSDNAVLPNGLKFTPNISKQFYELVIFPLMKS